MIYLTVKDDQIIATENDDIVAQISTWDDLNAFASSYGDQHILCSSSLDFPEEETDNQDVIAMCSAIRNG